MDQYAVKDDDDTGGWGMGSDNPFGGGDVVGSSGGVGDDYAPNPFDQPESAPPPMMKKGTIPTAQPAGALQAKPPAPPLQKTSWGGVPASSSSSTAAPSSATTMTDDLARREKELERRERDLNRRERLLTGTGQIKNWPKCYPIVYQDIANDIPEANQRMVKLGYMCWLLTFASYFWFLVCSIAALIVETPTESTSSNLRIFIVNSFAVVIGVPASFYYWYRTLYMAGKTDAVLRYAWFFVHFFIHIVWSVWTAVGAPFLNYPVGFINMIQAFDQNKVVGFFYLISFILWTVVSVISIMLQGYTIRKFRGQGGVEELNKQRKQAQATASVVATVANATSSFQGQNAA